MTAADRARMARDDQLRQQFAARLSAETATVTQRRTELRRRYRAPEYSEVIPTAPGWYVYRFWAADGRCLYVGMVGDNGPRDVRERIGEHRRTKPWWPLVKRIDVATCPEWGSAGQEVIQIQALSPVYNIRDKPDA